MTYLLGSAVLIALSASGHFAAFCFFGMTHRDEFGHLKGGSIVYGVIVLALVSSVGFGTEIFDTLDWRSIGWLFPACIGGIAGFRLGYRKARLIKGFQQVRETPKTVRGDAFDPTISDNLLPKREKNKSRLLACSISDRETSRGGR